MEFIIIQYSTVGLNYSILFYVPFCSFKYFFYYKYLAA